MPSSCRLGGYQTVKKGDCMRKAILLVALVAGLAAITGFFGTGKALAYGKADQPLAQLALSANCDNPSFPLCSPTTGVGLGGIWAWVEVDANGTGDMTGAGCDHAGAGGGGSGGGPLGPTDITWEIMSLQQLPPQFFVLGHDPNDQYYVINELGPFAFPVTNGHYSTRLAPGVQIQATVAP
jgi:hypothetical protein